METLALILAGGRGSRLDILSEKRVKPAVPFAGKYRIIDFTLSNCSNSGLYHIGILTQYLPLSLNEHLGVGKPWDLDRRDTKLSLLQPYKEWYAGTADSVRQNIEYVRRSNAKYVIILSGDHVYKMNYQKMIDAHKERKADLTIGVQEVDFEDTHRFGILRTDQTDKIIEFQEKPKTTDSNLASMGIYVFNTDVLLDVLETMEEENLDFGKHVIPHLIGGEVYSYTFKGYWKDVGTYDAYLQANLELTATVDKIPLDMYDRHWRIFTRSEELPAVKVGSNASINQALISNGSIIAGTVKRSVLSPGVIVHPGAHVENSVILNDCEIMPGATLKNAILDKNVHVGFNVTIGSGDDYEPNKERPELLFSGLNVIGKSVNIPDNMTITRNCRIFSNATLKNEPSTLKAGTTIQK